MRENTMPCRGCREKSCPQKGCLLWKRWFRGAWKQVNCAGWEAMDRLGKEKFVYWPPNWGDGPCSLCPCSRWCDRPCSLRMAWWDRSMARLRGSMLCH